MTWHPVSICSSASSSVLNVKIDDGAKLAYVFTRSLLQAFDSLLFLLCCFAVTSWLHSRALSRPETSSLLSAFTLHTLANTVCLLYLPLTCMPSSSKEKLLYLVIPGISLFPTAVGILEVLILQTATRVPLILVEIPVHFSRYLPSPCHCFLIRNFSDVTCMAQFCGQ